MTGRKKRPSMICSISKVIKPKRSPSLFHMAAATVADHHIKDTYYTILSNAFVNKPGRIELKSYRPNHVWLVGVYLFFNGLLWQGSLYHDGMSNKSRLWPVDYFARLAAQSVYSTWSERRSWITKLLEHWTQRDTKTLKKSRLETMALTNTTARDQINLSYSALFMPFCLCYSSLHYKF